MDTLSYHNDASNGFCWTQWPMTSVPASGSTDGALDRKNGISSFAGVNRTWSMPNLEAEKPSLLMLELCGFMRGLGSISVFSIVPGTTSTAVGGEKSSALFTIGEGGRAMVKPGLPGLGFALAGAEPTAGAAKGVLISSSGPARGSGRGSFLEAETGEEAEEEDWLAALTRFVYET